MSKTISKIYANIKLAWQTSELTDKEIAEKLGLKPSNLAQKKHKIFKGENVNVDTLNKLIEVFNIEGDE